MRLNKFLAQHTELSRRKADDAIAEGRVEINGVLARLGDTVIESDKVSLDGQKIEAETSLVTLLLNKPAGYICSRNGQGSKTVYNLLPATFHHLNPVGRLDKESSGLLLMSNDGDLANRLTHPSFGKDKHYTVDLDKRLHTADLEKIAKTGVDIGDERPSRFKIMKITETRLEATLQEGRNRQIRRTFEALGYKIKKLHRTHFGKYTLGSLEQGKYRIITPDE